MVLVSLCPDGGTCHHSCGMFCWRERNCEPLSGVFVGDKWPTETKDQDKELGYGYMPGSYSSTWTECLERGRHFWIQTDASNAECEHCGALRFRRDYGLCSPERAQEIVAEIDATFRKK